MHSNYFTDCKNKKAYCLSMAKSGKDNEFASRFKRMVDEKGWGNLGRLELGKKLGVSTSCAHFYLNGERLPSIDSARNIADIFNVQVEWLLTGKGGMRPGFDYCNPLFKAIDALPPEQQKIIEMMVASLTGQPVQTGQTEQQAAQTGESGRQKMEVGGVTPQ